MEEEREGRTRSDPGGGREEGEGREEKCCHSLGDDDTSSGWVESWNVNLSLMTLDGEEEVNTWLEWRSESFPV